MPMLRNNGRGIAAHDLLAQEKAEWPISRKRSLISLLLNAKKKKNNNPKTLKKCIDITRGEKNLFGGLELRTKQSDGCLAHYILSV